MATKNILIVGVGGQGTLLAGKVLGNYALLNDMDVKVSEVHGMAQRGGGVVTYVRWGEDVAAPVIDAGTADVMIAFEPLEALRWAHVLKEDGILISETTQKKPLLVTMKKATYPKDIEQRLKDKTKHAILLSASEEAEKLGDARMTNIILLGAFTKEMDLDEEKMKSAIENSIRKQFLEANLKAFELGLSHAKSIDKGN